MRFTLLRRAAFVAAVGALALPASALGVANIVQSDDALRDFDARVGKVAPTKAQKAAVKRLHASVTWNRFGTPETLSKRGKFLAKRVRGKNGPEAARRWIHRNRALFRLTSTAGLELVGDTRMPFSRGHAVNFRQVVQGLETVEGGLITIGLTGSAKKGWNIVSVTSSLTRNTALDGRAKLSAPRPGCGLRAPSASRAFRRRTSAKPRLPAAGPISRSADSPTSRRSGPSRSRPSAPGSPRRSSRSC